MSAAKERPTSVHRTFLPLVNGNHKTPYMASTCMVMVVLRTQRYMKYYGKGGSLNHTRSFGIRQRFGYASWTVLRTAPAYTKKQKKSVTLRQEGYSFEGSCSSTGLFCSASSPEPRSPLSVTDSQTSTSSRRRCIRNTSGPRSLQSEGHGDTVPFRYEGLPSEFRPPSLRRERAFWKASKLGRDHTERSDSSQWMFW